MAAASITLYHQQKIDSFGAFDLPLFSFDFVLLLDVASVIVDGALCVQ